MELFEHIAKPLVSDLIQGRNGENTTQLQKETTLNICVFAFNTLVVVVLITPLVWLLQACFLHMG